LALAAKLGFVQVGSQMDEVDGREWVFELEWRTERAPARDRERT
jgi:hypothetical protein